MGLHVSPPSRLLKQPPPSGAAKRVVGVGGSTATALTLPSSGPCLVHTPPLAMLDATRARPQNTPASIRRGRGDPVFVHSSIVRSMKHLLIVAVRAARPCRACRARSRFHS